MQLCAKIGYAWGLILSVTQAMSSRRPGDARCGGESALPWSNRHPLASLKGSATPKISCSAETQFLRSPYSKMTSSRPMPDAGQRLSLLPPQHVSPVSTTRLAENDSSLDDATATLQQYCDFQFRIADTIEPASSLVSPRECQNDAADNVRTKCVLELRAELIFACARTSVLPTKHVVLNPTIFQKMR